MFSLIFSWRRAIVALIGGGALSGVIAAPAAPSDSAMWICVGVVYVVATGVLIWHWQAVGAAYEVGHEDGAEAVLDAIRDAEDADDGEDDRAPLPVLNVAEVVR